MKYSTIYSKTSNGTDGTITRDEIIREVEIISKSVHSVIEQEFNKFEKRITIYHGVSNDSNDTSTIKPTDSKES